MAKRKPTHTGWKAPGQGTRAREAMPRTAFFRPASRKYPYKVKRGGRWVPSRAGVAAAIVRAGQHGASDVVTKARRVQKSKGWLPKSYRKR